MVTITKAEVYKILNCNEYDKLINEMNDLRLINTRLVSAIEKLDAEKQELKNSLREARRFKLYGTKRRIISLGL